MSSARRELTWPLYLDEVLPELLQTGGCSEVDRLRIVEDVAERATSYAAGGRRSRVALRAPLLEDVAQFEPQPAPVGVRADTAVVVRCSLLEDAHAAGPVDDADLTAITTLATGALNHWLAQNANTSDGDPPQGVFAEVLDAPVGWAALSALAEASIDGGRVAFHQPDADLPTVPAVEAEQVRRTEGGAWVQSAVSHGWTQGLLDMLVRTDSGEIGAWTVSSLSRLTRSSSRLSWLLAFALSRGVPVVTSNFLLRPGEAFVRKGPLRVPEPTRPTLHLRDGAGLAGVHRKLARELADQLEMA